MRLVWQATGRLVAVGDPCVVGMGRIPAKVVYFHPPPCPSSDGRVTIHLRDEDRNDEYPVGAIHAEWVGREDRVEEDTRAMELCARRLAALTTQIQAQLRPAGEG
jgi:hypothetical protein